MTQLESLGHEHLYGLSNELVAGVNWRGGALANRIKPCESTTIRASGRIPELR